MPTVRLDSWSMQLYSCLKQAHSMTTSMPAFGTFNQLLVHVQAGVEHTNLLFEKYS